MSAISGSTAVPTRPTVPVLAVLAAAAALSVVATVAISAPGRSGQAQSARVTAAAGRRPQTVPRLPLAAQGPVSRALGRDQRTYWAAPTRDGGFLLSNRAQRLRARVGPGGLSARSGAGTLGLRLLGYGDGGRLRLAGAGVPRAHANRVTVVRAGLTEWYANGPLGLEQGFTVKSAPAGRVSGRLTVALGMSGDLRSALASGGGAVRFSGRGGSLTYSGLAATDARGRRLPARFALRGDRLLIEVDTAGARYPVAIDPLLQQASLTSTDGVLHSVAISGDTIVAGAPSANGGAGEVDVFVKPAGGWADATQTATLQANGASDGDLGSSVAISADGDTIVGGAPERTVVGDLDGAMYVFAKPAGGWANATQTSELTAPSQPGGEIGYSVAMSADGATIAASALNASGTGANVVGGVDVFTRPGPAWPATDTSVATLLQSDGARLDEFPGNVAMSADGATIVAGAPDATVGANQFQGAVYLFTRPAGGWVSATQTAKLTASDGQADDLLGYGVAVVGSTVIAGAPLASVGGNRYQGAVYVFTPPAGGWRDETQSAKLTVPGAAAGQSLGAPVVLSSSATTALAGAGGSVYAFTEGSHGWANATVAATMTPAPPITVIYGIGVSGGTVAVDSIEGAVSVFGPGLPPAFTSSAAATVTVGQPGSATVTSTGLPAPALSLGGGSLPAGVSFVDNGDGTATVSGTPAAGTAGTYRLALTASNGIAPAATQAFTLTVLPAPAPPTPAPPPAPAPRRPGRPVVSITSPRAGARLMRGRRVLARYRCRDGAGGPGIRSCTGTVARGARVDTSRRGPHKFTVTATSRDGQRRTRSVSYTVVFPSNRFSVRAIRTFRDGTVRFRVGVPGRGRIDVLETAWHDNLARVAVRLQPAPRRFVFARARALARRRGSVWLAVRPNVRGRRLIARPRYRVTLRLWVSYTPVGGVHRSIGFYGLHPPR